jgi:phage FluMu protein Com
MLEIIGMIVLFQKLKEMLLKKGRGQGLAFLGPLFWITCEFMGAITGGIITAITGNQSTMFIYLIALLGALLGIVISVMIVHFRSPHPLYCPSCNAQLPSSVMHTYAKVKCQSCKENLKVQNSIVEIFHPPKRKHKTNPIKKRNVSNKISSTDG